jgi:hypothetical protein
MSKATRIHCPICNRENDFFADPVGPFCSKRCKLVDLGKWLGEEYCVSEPLRPEHFAEDENLSGGDPDRPDAR